jgi:hypothetical protein
MTSNGTIYVALDTLIAGENQTLNVLETVPANEYETVAAAQTDQVLGSVGAVGDYLDSLLLTVGAATAITVKDNATTIFTFTFGAAVTTGPESVSPTYATRTAPSNYLATNPLFVDSSKPWLGLKPGSPCQSAGAYIQGAKDRFGRRYLIPPNIGPWAVLPRA